MYRKVTSNIYQSETKTEVSAMNILKSGDWVSVSVKGKETVYEFLGFDLDDAGAKNNGGTGCRYIILRNLETDELTCVEAAWFTETLTGRNVTRKERI